MGVMEERLDRMEKSINDLIGIVVAIKDYMTIKLATKEELAETEERLNAKIEGVQRSVDGAYELHSALEVRVTKLETAR